jgi:hypothetical protein
LGGARRNHEEREEPRGHVTKLQDGIKRFVLSFFALFVPFVVYSYRNSRPWFDVSPNKRIPGAVVGWVAMEIGFQPVVSVTNRARRFLCIVGPARPGGRAGQRRSDRNPPQSRHLGRRAAGILPSLFPSAGCHSKGMSPHP